jgi:hypothetical protein
MFKSLEKLDVTKIGKRNDEILVQIRREGQTSGIPILVDVLFKLKPKQTMFEATQAFKKAATSNKKGLELSTNRIEQIIAAMTADEYITKLFTKFYDFEHNHNHSDRYAFHPTFLSYLQIIGRMIKEDSMVKEIGDFDFIRAILLPDYFTMSRLIREKYAAMPDYQKKADKCIISFTMEDVARIADKEESFEEMSDEQWDELTAISRIVYNQMVMTEKKIAKFSSSSSRNKQASKQMSE